MKIYSYVEYCTGRYSYSCILIAMGALSDNKYRSVYVTVQLELRGIYRLSQYGKNIRVLMTNE